jgi:hypothetical protein
MRSADEGRPAYISGVRRWRAARAVAVLSGGLTALAAAAPASDADITRSFDAQVARLDAQDPSTPQALETHLRYAEYLAEEPGPDCDARLAAAQAQLQAAQRQPALGVIMPQGLARAADLDYQIHAARAACGAAADAAPQASELQAALAAAQRVAALYRDSFDYPAMVTEQYNAAVTQQRLGDTQAAQTALISVIDADREYGFRDDAEENGRLLSRWTHADAQATARMQDFPERSTTLRFAWVAGDNDITLTTRSARLIGASLAQAEGDRDLRRRVRRTASGWIITYASLGSHYALGPAPAGTEASLMSALAVMLTRFHDFSLRDTRAGKLGPSADFKEALDRDSFNARVHEEAGKYRRANASLAGISGGSAAAALAPVLTTELDNLLNPAVIDLNTALDYNLETGAWPGATLEQGQWYGMDMSMPLPFAPLTVVQEHVQFAFTRELPCNGAAKRTCVEIVLRAVPDPGDLERILRHLPAALHLKHGAKLHAWSTLSMRLVTDPATLEAYQRDLRQYFYVSVEGVANATLLGSDQALIDSSPVKPPAD